MPVMLGQACSISGLSDALKQAEFATTIGLVKFGSLQQKSKAGKSGLLTGIKETIGSLMPGRRG